MSRGAGKRNPRHKNRSAADPAAEAFQAGYDLLEQTWTFAPMLRRAAIIRRNGNLCPLDGWAVVTSNGDIHVHPSRRAAPEEWQYVLAHCLLHLAFEHFQPQATDELFRLWNVACDIFVSRFLAQLKIGQAPPEMAVNIERLPAQNEAALFRHVQTQGAPDDWLHCSTTGPGGADMALEPLRHSSSYSYWHQGPPDWPHLFAQGVSLGVKQAVAQASDIKLDHDGELNLSQAEKARRWFIDSYPLLGALAVNFKLIEDPVICRRWQISVAAVDAAQQELYLNPAAGLSPDELRFVMAHELLHVGLRHDVRQQGRDAFLWNVACDYVINSWLIEMGIGVMPDIGGLYDETLKGMSAESIYDLIVRDLRKCQRAWTLRGKGLGDILPAEHPGWWRSADGMRLDDFYRNCLAQGLDYHQSQGRGLIPAGLVQEIQALSQPPIPWDVELARWFDAYFPPLEKHRSYARLSRRQSATPHIPRPSWTTPLEADRDRTFGVILDTSGSMDTKLLAKALGAIASYSLSREVARVRVVFCDAAHYDQGYMAPEAIAARVRVRGRGGTILQPAIDLLQHAPDFPKDGPLLIITDGFIDRLTIRSPRPHAYLIPKGGALPFVPKGEVFYFS